MGRKNSGRKIILDIDECRDYALKEGFLLLNKKWKMKTFKLTLIHIDCGRKFKMRWSEFERGRRCSRCSGKLKPTLKEILSFCKNKGYKLLSKEYKNANTKILFRHLVCGYEFRTTWAAFKSNKGLGCSKCSGNLKLTIEHCSEIAESRGYVLLEKEYVNAITEMNFFHISCGNKFLSSWNSFNPDGGCKICSYKKSADKRNDNKRKIIGSLGDIFPEIIKEWSSKNEKSPFEYLAGSGKKVWWTCEKHEDYVSSIDSRTRNNNTGSGCPVCRQSKGEKRIFSFLISCGLKENVDFFTEKTFRDCKNESYLPFDFYIPSLNILIEYDGIAHFKPIRFGGISEEEAKENLKSQKKRDRIKNKFCKKENYNLLRISYLEFNDVELILEKTLKNLLVIE